VDQHVHYTLWHDTGFNIFDLNLIPPEFLWYSSLSLSLSLSLPTTALAVHTLDEASTYFSTLNCKQRLRDIHYLQARLHHSLGRTAQRNQSAMLFHLLDPELQTPTVPADMRL